MSDESFSFLPASLLPHNDNLKKLADDLVYQIILDSFREKWSQERKAAIQRRMRKGVSAASLKTK